MFYFYLFIRQTIHPWRSRPPLVGNAKFRLVHVAKQLIFPLTQIGEFVLIMAFLIFCLYFGSFLRFSPSLFHWVVLSSPRCVERPGNKNRSEQMT